MTRARKDEVEGHLTPAGSTKHAWEYQASAGGNNNKKYREGGKEEEEARDAIGKRGRKKSEGDIVT